MAYTGEKKRLYDMARLTKRRESWLQKLGGACKRCNTTEKLEFDHIDPRTKEQNVSHMWTRREEVIAAEMAKCQLLCESCHRAKTAEDNLWMQPRQHGPGSYRKGCRCDKCKAAVSKYRRAYHLETGR